MDLNTYNEINPFLLNAPRFNPTPIVVVGIAFMVGAYHEVNMK